VIPRTSVRLLAILLLPTLLSCQRPTPPPTITTIHIGPEVLRTHVKRLGINLSGQSFYDSGQLLRNLTFRNPGFEGQTWSSILRCKSLTPTTCTDQNQYSTWTAGFLNGARYEWISGPAHGQSGTITATAPATPDHGVTITLDSPSRAIADDFLLIRIDQPGHAEAGWWPNLQSGATLATEFHDLSPNSPGKQALRIEASARGQSAAIHSYFDSYNGRSFLHLNQTLTLTFRAKLLVLNTQNSKLKADSSKLKAVLNTPSSTQPQNLEVSLERLDTTHGRHSFFSKSVPLTPTWHDYTFQIPAQDVPDAVGTIGLTFTFAGLSALLDDVALTAPAAPSNPTAFRNEVVQTLRDLHPGVLRYMDNGTNFGSSLDNLLAPPFARLRTGSTTRGMLQEDIPIGLHEFLVLCKAIGAEPWFSLPPVTTLAEAAHLAEYLTGAPTTPYGAIRARLGQRDPWSTVFSTIHLELGNEQWNYGSFAGATLNDPTAYGRRAAEIFAALGQSPHFDLILGSWATVPWWTQQEISTDSGFNSIAVAPYLFNDFQDASSTESTFGPMLAEPESIDSRPTGYMAQQTNALQNLQLTTPKLTTREPSPSAHPPQLAVYEVNLGALTGSAAITQADLDRTLPSLGAGLAVADHMLLMLRDLGVTTQCLFALPEFQNTFSAPGPRRLVPLWGAVVDMGGPTNLRRPQFLTTQLANQAILPTMLTTRIDGPNPTWNQPKSPNAKTQLPDAHLLQSFAFADGPRHSLILLNLSRTFTLPIAFSGPATPKSTVEETRLTSTKIDSTNETQATIQPEHRTLTNFNPNTPYPLPPFSMTVLTWQSR
jgi:hypothetical protein